MRISGELLHRDCKQLDDLVAMIPDGAALMVGGFLGFGSPHRLLQGLAAAGRKGFALIGAWQADEMAVIEPTAERLVLRERAPGVSVADVVSANAAKLIIPPTVPEFALS